MAISLEAVVQFVVTLLVAGLIFWLLVKLVDAFPSLGPYKEVARGAVWVCAILFLIGLLLSVVTGRPLFVLR